MCFKTSFSQIQYNDYHCCYYFLPVIRYFLGLLLLLLCLLMKSILVYHLYYYYLILFNLVAVNNKPLHIFKLINPSNIQAHSRTTPQCYPGVCYKLSSCIIICSFNNKPLTYYPVRSKASLIRFFQIFFTIIILLLLLLFINDKLFYLAQQYPDLFQKRSSL